MESATSPCIRASLAAKKEMVAIPVYPGAAVKTCLYAAPCIHRDPSVLQKMFFTSIFKRKWALS